MTKRERPQCVRWGLSRRYRYRKCVTAIFSPKRSSCGYFTPTVSMLKWAFVGDIVIDNMFCARSMTGRPCNPPLFQPFMLFGPDHPLPTSLPAPYTILNECPQSVPLEAKFHGEGGGPHFGKGANPNFQGEPHTLDQDIISDAVITDRMCHIA